MRSRLPPLAAEALINVYAAGAICRGPDCPNVR